MKHFRILDRENGRSLMPSVDGKFEFIHSPIGGDVFAAEDHAELHENVILPATMQLGTLNVNVVEIDERHPDCLESVAENLIDVLEEQLTADHWDNPSIIEAVEKLKEAIYKESQLLAVPGKYVPLMGTMRTLDIFRGELPQDVINMIDLNPDLIEYRDTKESLGEDLISVSMLEEEGWDEDWGGDNIRAIEDIIESARNNRCTYIRLTTMP